MEDIVYYYPEGHQAHYEAGHPERPDRIEVMLSSLKDSGWWEPYPHLEALELPTALLESVHSPEYLTALASACHQGAHLDMDTYTTPASWNLGLQAAGGAAATAQSVWECKAKRGLALTRPPGHHATINRGMGFCLLNNIALAAQHLLALPDIPPDRLAIVDLDLHHGNGTQDIFWSRREVFFFSTHQSPFYPGTGRLQETGGGEGQGYTANFPLPPWTGDSGYLSVMEEAILPLLDQYDPQMILVSVGFDPHWRDPLGSMALTAGGYGHLIRQLAQWADDHCRGRIALFLEGGYDLEAGAVCVQAWVASLLDIPWKDPLGPSMRPEGSSWQAVLRSAKQIWELD